MMAALLFAQFVLLGANIVFPWRLAHASPERRRLFRVSVVPALLLSAILAILHLGLRPDAALFWGLKWPPETLFVRLFLVLIAAGGLSAAILALGGRELEPLGWRVASAIALALAAGGAVAGELLRIGGGPAGSLRTVAIASAVRLAVIVATGEALTGRPRGFALLAGGALPALWLSAPAALRSAVRIDLWTLAAAAALFLLAGLLPPRQLRLARIAALAGAVLTALYFARAGELSAMLQRSPPIPDIVLPDP